MNYMVEEYRVHRVHDCGGHLVRLVSEGDDERYEMVFCMWCGEHAIKSIGAPDSDWQHVSKERSEAMTGGAIALTR